MFGLHQMLSDGKAGIDPGRWAYATLSKPLDLEVPEFTTAGPWPPILVIRASGNVHVQRGQDHRRSVGGSSRSHHGPLPMKPPPAQNSSAITLPRGSCPLASRPMHIAPTARLSASTRSAPKRAMTGPSSSVLRIPPAE